MMTQRPYMQALLLADHIYRDVDTGKYVIAGTFHHLGVSAIPTAFGRSIGVFISLRGIEGKVQIRLEWQNADQQEVLMNTPSFEIACENPNLPVEFAIEVPPLPLPYSGHYLFRLFVDGVMLGTTTLMVHMPESERP